MTWIPFIILAVVVLCCLPDIFNMGWGETYELLHVDHYQIEYIVRRGKTETRKHWYHPVPFSCSTRELEWTTARLREYLEARRGKRRRSR